MGYTVTLDRATIEFSSADTPATVYTAEATTLLAAKTADAYGAEIDYFAQCCDAGRPPDLCPPSESAAAVKLMLQILEARERKGEKIRCNL
jgi:hypothetical protein